MKIPEPMLIVFGFDALFPPTVTCFGSTMSC